MGVIMMGNTTRLHLPSDTWSHDPLLTKQPFIKHLGNEYIIRARDAEMQRHVHSMSQLQKKMKQLSRELAWEFEQHQSKMQELIQLEKPVKKHRTRAKIKVEADHRSVIPPIYSPTMDLCLTEELPCEAVA